VEQEKLKEALREHGAVLAREGRHQIYRLPNGRQVVISKSASDYRGVRNAISLVKRMARVPADPELRQRSM
jgi:predicted RNA binding protein YcfA (HicA-like mRNA interferase family)